MTLSVQKQSTHLDRPVLALEAVQLIGVAVKHGQQAAVGKVWARKTQVVRLCSG